MHRFQRAALYCATYDLTGRRPISKPTYADFNGTGTGAVAVSVDRAIVDEAGVMVLGPARFSTSVQVLSFGRRLYGSATASQ